MENLQPYIDLIASQTDASQPLYLLVDPLKPVYPEERLHLQVLRHRFGQNAVAVVPRADLSHTPADCPHLIMLFAPGEPFDPHGPYDSASGIMRHSIEFARNESAGHRRYVCGWLQSALDIESLAQTLADRMVFTQDGHTHIYPVYEPLRQELIAYSEQPQTHSDWLADISQWIIPASNRGFMCLTGQQPAQSTPIPLTERAILAQADMPTVAHGLNTWLLQATGLLTPQELQQMPLLIRGPNALPQGAAYLVWQALHAAKNAGLTDPHDRTLFAMLRLLTHPRFDQHPTVQAAIQRTVQQAGHTTLAQQLESVDAAQWQRILNQLNT